MVVQHNQLDFSGQHFFIGLDVHDKSWTVTIRSNHMVLKRFRMNPSPKELGNYMNRHYPSGSYHSVYEAGFCGFWIHRQLSRLGFDNMVIHPADVPTTNKERVTKRDKPDSGKLARELENGSLRPIYVPDEYHEQLRGLVRYRYRLVKRQTQIKNRIKAHLHLHGVQIPPQQEVCHWSGAFIIWLEGLEFSYPFGKDYLMLSIRDLKEIRHHLVEATRLLRKYVKENARLHKIVKEDLLSIKGIGFVAAITLYTEIIDLNRFPKLDHLCAYVGLIPSIYGSGDKETEHGLTSRRNRYLRYLIIEAAWVATRKDPALTLAFAELTKRMKKQDAIIRIAKKLLNRIRYVWQNQATYKMAVIQ
jgi:transposase